MKNVSAISLLIKIYLLVLSIFSVFRLMLFFTEINRLEFSFETIQNVVKAFIMGIRFDIVITGYVMILPGLFLLIQDIIIERSKFAHRFIRFWIFFLFSLAFVICAADIPYFNQFFSRFSIGAFNWMDSPRFVFNMIIEEPRYFLVVFPWVILVYLFYKFLQKIFRQDYPISKMNIAVKIFLSVIFLFLMLLGIRGRVETKSPIRTGTAYFCNDPFINQLGLNPVFTLFKSYQYQLKEKNSINNFIDEKVAIQNVQRHLSIENPLPFSPIAKKILPDTINEIKHNIVLIIMESMSAAKMQRHGNESNMTPFLDSLSYQSIYFENIYTAGKHTYSGIFSTLFSLPTIKRHHPLKSIKKYDGIASILKLLGYSTTYFTTHDSQFDNVEGFLRANDFENIISQSNYPSEEVKTVLGVPDDFMFRYSIPIINKIDKQGKPFFVTFMTGSDHGPYYIPDYFTPHTNKTETQIVEYADWSLSRFIEMASKTEWFDNTIFVFVADHGAALNVYHNMSLNYFHSPLIFYAPEILTPKLYSNIGGQIDVCPTIMGLLKQPYIKNNLGVDLINDKRPYTFFNGDDKTGVLDNEYLLIINNDNSKELYKYKGKEKTNYINEYIEKAKEMEIYIKSNLQVSYSFQSRK